MAAAERTLQPAAERFLSLAEQLDSPAVLIDLAPGVSTYARLEILDAPNGPSAADVRTLQPAAERFLSLSEQLNSPSVLIDFNPGVCASSRLEILDAPHGPAPADVVRKAARTLGVFPGALDAEFDAVFPGDPDPEAFHLMIGGRRVGLVYGMDLDAFIDAVIAVGAANLKRRKS